MAGFSGRSSEDNGHSKLEVSNMTWTNAGLW